MSFRTPLARARGYGSTKQGTAHFWAQRLTAVALLPLCAWFVYSMVAIGGSRYEAVHAWVGQPAAALLFGAFVVSLFYHAQLGLQVVIEDYVRTKWLKVSGLMLLKLLTFLLAAAAVFALLRISLGS